MDFVMSTFPVLVPFKTFDVIKLNHKPNTHIQGRQSDWHVQIILMTNDLIKQYQMYLELDALLKSQ